MTFSWFGRQMESANVNGTAITYKYNADGLRTEKKVGSTVSKYEYTGDKLFYEKRGDLEFHYRYDVFGNVASITRVKADGTSFSLYTVCNSRGDVEELRRSTGELFARYVYDSWGNVLHIYDASGAEITSTANFAVQNPFRYRGYYYDNETGLYYLQSRYYDPVTHRFLNADNQLATDSDLTGFNLFAYCGNNPITREDSGGQFWETALDVVSLAFSVADVIKNPKSVWAWVGLAADVASLVIPFATGGGAVVKAISKTDNLVDTVKAVNKTANVVDTTHDITKTTVKNLNFDSTENLLKHFTEHNSQFGDLFSSADEYLSGANYVINNGQFVPELNGYIRFLGTGGKANYAFVGLKNAGKNISTFHVKKVKDLAKIPSLGFFY